MLEFGCALRDGALPLLLIYLLGQEGHKVIAQIFFIKCGVDLNCRR